MGEKGGDRALLELLSKHFGHTRFRSPEQEGAIRQLMARRGDVYVSMPTGSGKSLVYQLPAAAAKGCVAVVVSPLIALIKDQMEQLARKGIPAEPSTPRWARGRGRGWWMISSARAPTHGCST